MSALIKVDYLIGVGTLATTGRSVVIRYAAWLYDPETADHRGRQFDCSDDHVSSCEFSLGAGYELPAWDQGIEGMRVGGVRVLIVPSDLAYGRRGLSNLVPPNSKLVYEIELLDVI